MRTIRTSFATAVQSPCRCTPIAKRSNASSAISLSCRTAMITAACANRLRICARGSIRIDCALSGKLQRQAIDEAELRPVITGFNTDIRHNDKVYHIQTEDKGLQNPYIESLVYVGGDILASEAESEHLELSLLTNAEFFAGSPVELRIAARKSLSQNPVPAAVIEVKVISTVEAPQVIFKGKTSGDGTAVIRCTIPAFREGTAAIIISAQSPIGNDEVKQLVKRRK